MAVFPSFMPQPATTESPRALASHSQSQAPRRPGEAESLGAGPRTLHFET